MASCIRDWHWLQAVIGVAFSVGFLLGPLIGAYFSVQARGRGAEAGGGTFYVAPALFALTLSLINIAFIALCMRETLPRECRVGIHSL